MNRAKYSYEYKCKNEKNVKTTYYFEYKRNFWKECKNYVF